VAGAEGFAYAAIPIIKTIPEPLRSEIRESFTDSLRTIWQVSIGIAALGFLSVFFLKHYALAKTTDDHWGIEQKKAKDEEVGKDVSI